MIRFCLIASLCLLPLWATPLPAAATPAPSLAATPTVAAQGVPMADVPAAVNAAPATGSGWLPWVLGIGLVVLVGVVVASAGRSSGGGSKSGY